MKPDYINKFNRVMKSIDVDDSVKHQIIKNCARKSTLQKIKAGKFKIIAVIRETTIDKI